MVDLSGRLNFVASFKEFVKNTKDRRRKKNNPDDYTCGGDTSARGKISKAISRAKKDIMTRTLTEKKDAPGPFGDEKFKVFADDLKRCFDNPARDGQKKFDECFKDECDKVEKRFSLYCDGVELGKTQKLVHMTFKHLYCFAHTDEKGEHVESCRRDKEMRFRFCRMPIDSYIMDWAIREDQISKDKTASSDHSSDDILAWSKFVLRQILRSTKNHRCVDKKDA